MICNNQINNYLFVACYGSAKDFDVAAGFQIYDRGIAGAMDAVGDEIFKAAFYLYSFGWLDGYSLEINHTGLTV